jgi:hypothetical protein
MDLQQYDRSNLAFVLAASPCSAPIDAPRFFPLIEKGSGCWVWRGRTDRWGYGRFHSRALKRDIAATRFWFYLQTGELLPPTTFVCHHCDNPTCVRPDHLFLGTHQDNMRDMARKGRSYKGGPARAPRLGRVGKSLSPRLPDLAHHNAPNAKITECLVVEIANRYAANPMPLIKLGSEFGLARRTLREILSGRSWKHVSRPIFILPRGGRKRFL